MDESEHEARDPRLVALFERDPEPGKDAAFTGAVMTRVRRQARVRRVVLAAAVVCGAAISYGPMGDLTTLVGAALGESAAHWRTLSWTPLVASAAFNVTWPFVLLATLRTLFR